MVPFYTAYLTTSEYGISDLISTTVLLVIPIFSLLMDESIMRFALDKDSDKKQVFTTATCVSSIGFVLALILSPILLLFECLKDYYWFVLLYYVSLWAYNIFANYVKGLDRLGVISIAGMLHTFLFLGLNILFLAGIKIGIYGYLLAIDISNIIAALFLFCYCRLYKQFVSPKILDIALIKRMVKYSLPMIPDYISWWFVNCSDRYMLTAMVGTSATGVYSVAYKIPTILVSVNSIFCSAWKISSVDNFGSEESINFYNRVYKAYSSSLIIISGILIIFVKPLASILFSNEFFSAWKITPLLIISYIVCSQAIFVGSIFTASKKTKKLFYAPLVGAVVNILLNMILIPKYEGIGAAIATCIGYYAILQINIYNTGKILKMEYNNLKYNLLYIILIIECIIIMLDYTFSTLFAGLPLAVILLILRKEVMAMVRLLANKLKFNNDGANR
jgi:O-antigen/teichoic acid export membrane protein